VPLTLVAAVPVVIWLYLLFARGGFWRVRPHLLPSSATPNPARIVAVVPARDEAAVIGEAVRSLLHQALPVPMHVILVDDGSSDGTAEVARRVATHIGSANRLTVLAGKPLPSGWTGKLWAVSQGVAAAARMKPDYYLLTDADIQHDVESIGRLLAFAQERCIDLASYMVKLSVDSLAEKLLIPAFVYFFFQLYPPRWIATQKSSTAGAAGGCMLIRTEALERAGGITAIRSALIDDCALAAAVKKSGGKIWLGLTNQSRSIRSYGDFAGVGQMISRSAFHQLHHSTVLLVLTIMGLGVTYLLAPLLLFAGKAVPMLLGGVAWALMSISYLPMLRLYRRSALWSLSLPLIATFYAGCTIHSAFRFWTGSGGKWKGRAQDTLNHR
jgi:hopene-associated glycosyltransferase HpnB